MVKYFIGLMISVVMSVNAATLPESSSIVVPFSPGGLVDVNARMFAKVMEKVTQQNVVVTNRPGAAGVIGTSAIVAANNTNTLTFGLLEVGGAIASSVLGVPSSPKLGQLVPICVISSWSSVIYVHADTPANNLRELAALMKANPKAAYGPITQSHILLSESYFDNADLRNMQPVFYKSLTEGLRAVAAKDIYYTLGDVGTALPFIESGKVKPLVVGGTERLSLWPTVPTMSESYRNLSSTNFMGLYVSKDTPQSFKDFLNKACNDVVKDKEMIDFLSRQYHTIGGGTIQKAQALADFHTRELEIAFGKYKDKLK